MVRPGRGKDRAEQEVAAAHRFQLGKKSARITTLQPLAVFVGSDFHMGYPVKTTRAELYTWITPTGCQEIPYDRATACWKSVNAPASITREDVYVLREKIAHAVHTVVLKPGAFTDFRQAAALSDRTPWQLGGFDPPRLSLDAPPILGGSRATSSTSIGNAGKRETHGATASAQSGQANKFRRCYSILRNYDDREFAVKYLFCCYCSCC